MLCQPSRNAENNGGTAQESGARNAFHKARKIKQLVGRGSWIRTNDLQYPKQVAAVDNPATSGQMA